MWNTNDPRLAIEKPYHTKIVIWSGANVWGAEIHAGEIYVPPRISGVLRTLLLKQDKWPDHWHWTFPPSKAPVEDEDVEVSEDERRHSG